MERKNKKYKRNLLKALYAIKGYQTVEIEIAEAEGLSVQAYRTRIRKDKADLFNTAFLIPNNITELIAEIEND